MNYLCLGSTINFNVFKMFLLFGLCVFCMSSNLRKAKRSQILTLTFMKQLVKNKKEYEAMHKQNHRAVFPFVTHKVSLCSIPPSSFSSAASAERLEGQCSVSADSDEEKVQKAKQRVMKPRVASGTMLKQVRPVSQIFLLHFCRVTKGSFSPKLLTFGDFSRS